MNHYWIVNSNHAARFNKKIRNMKIQRRLFFFFTVFLQGLLLFEISYNKSTIFVITIKTILWHFWVSIIVNYYMLSVNALYKILTTNMGNSGEKDQRSFFWMILIFSEASFEVWLQVFLLVFLPKKFVSNCNSKCSLYFWPALSCWDFIAGNITKMPHTQWF